MKRNLKLALATVSALAVFAAVDQAQAIDQNIEASIVTRAALAVANVVDMDFGDVEFALAHTGTIRLPTNGTAELVGATGLTLGGTSNAGSFDVTGDGESFIDIYCETGGTLADDDGNDDTLTLSATEIAIDTGVAGGAGNPCGGIAVGVDTPATSVDLSSTANPTILIGGSLDVTADAIDGSYTYSTANATVGDPVTVRVVYQ